jgi:hypothetical protein
MSNLVAKLNQLNLNFNAIDYIEKLRQNLEKEGFKSDVYLILNNSCEDKNELHFLTLDDEARNKLLRIGNKIEGFIPHAYTSSKLGNLGIYCKVY